MAASLARSLWFIPTIATLLSYYPNENSEANAPPKEAELIMDIYDYVIVGGGTAGSIVASRLSEDPSVSVLLLEAGGQETYEAQIPAVAPYLQLTDFDWQYKSAPSSTSCLAMNENRCNLPRGKVLGGSSSINLMLYVRGNKNDFNHWEMLGNPGWGYDQILPYFKKSEDNQDKKYSDNIEYHGTGGEQKIKEPIWKTPLADAFLEGGKELGYETTDINAENQTGFMFPQGFYYKGSRFSCSRAFLQPIRKRSNLNIKLHSLVTKILFDNYGRANKVAYERANRSLTVLAKREIILCGGAFSTPHLLMLSGIGPALHLNSIGINPFLDLPVGRNLQDHVAGQLPFVIDRPMTIKRQRMESFASVYQYTVYGSGPLSTLGAVEGLGFVHTKYSNRSLNWPDIEFQFISSSYASDDGRYIRHTINLQNDHWDNYLKPLSDLDAFTIVVKLLRPRSRGHIELESSDPRQMPKIVTNYMTEPVDTLTLLDGLKVAIALSETNAFKNLGTKLYNKPINGCENYEVISDEYWECFLRHLTLTIYHYSGTAKMGPHDDNEAVVDPELRVYGTSGLRVIDASIFPTIPSGNTNAAVMMVAEKGADMIKSFWRDVLFESTVEEFYAGLASLTNTYKEIPNTEETPIIIETSTSEEASTTEKIPIIEETPSKFNFLKSHFLSKRAVKSKRLKRIPRSVSKRKSELFRNQRNADNEISKAFLNMRTENIKDISSSIKQTDKMTNEFSLKADNSSVKYFPPSNFLEINNSNKNITAFENKLFVQKNLFKMFENVTGETFTLKENLSKTEYTLPQIVNPFNYTEDSKTLNSVAKNVTEIYNDTISSSEYGHANKWDRDHMDL